jgi:hypothetical protein
MTDISVQSTAFQVEKRSWLLSPHGTEPGTNPSITLDVSAFDASTHYPNGYILSGEPLAESAGLYVPYANQSSEVQKITVASSGNTTVGFQGVNAAATALAADAPGAAALQALLEGLPDIEPGDVTVTAGAGGDAGKLIVTFGGTWAGRDVPLMTVAGTGTAISTGTAGGAESPPGEGTGKGLLVAAVKVPNIADTTVNVGGGLLVHGFVKVSKLPRDPGAAFWADLPLIHHVA